jgi:hypothetical protein
MEQIGNVKVLFIAGFGPIVREVTASGRLYRQILGLRSHLINARTSCSAPFHDNPAMRPAAGAPTKMQSCHPKSASLNRSYGVRPIRRRSAVKRGSERKLSSDGSTLIQGIQFGRSSYAFSSHRKASSLSPR